MDLVYLKGNQGLLFLLEDLLGLALIGGGEGPIEEVLGYAEVVSIGVDLEGFIQVNEHLLSQSIEHSYRIAPLCHPQYRPVLERHLDRPVAVGCEPGQPIYLQLLIDLVLHRGHQSRLRETVFLI